MSMLIDFDFPEVLEVIWKKKFDCEVPTRQRVDLVLMASELPFSVSLENLRSDSTQRAMIQGTVRHLSC